MIDDCAGDILETLETLRCADDAPVVFTLDHGKPLAEHRLRRDGPPPFAQSLRVRLITAAQGMISGQRQQMVSNLNLRRTLACTIGIEANDDDKTGFFDAQSDRSAHGARDTFCRLPIPLGQEFLRPITDRLELAACALALSTRMGKIFGQRTGPSEQSLDPAMFYLNSRKGKILGPSGSSLAPDPCGDAIAVC